MSEIIALDKKLQKKYSKQTQRIKNQIKSGKIEIRENDVKRRKFRHVKEDCGIVLLRHVPHGFYEEEMMSYFSQFGRVTGVRLCRSMRTGRSKGYAFIRFADKEVAKIAAETMDNYLMFQKRLTAQYLEPHQAPSRIFNRKPISENNIPIERIRKNMNRNKNARLSGEKYVKKCKEKIAKINKTKRKLAELGIDYDAKISDIPAAVLNQQQKTTKSSKLKPNNQTPNKSKSKVKSTRKETDVKLTVRNKIKKSKPQ